MYNSTWFDGTAEEARWLLAKTVTLRRDTDNLTSVSITIPIDISRELEKQRNLRANGVIPRCNTGANDGTIF